MLQKKQIDKLIDNMTCELQERKTKKTSWIKGFEKLLALICNYL